MREQERERDGEKPKTGRECMERGGMWDNQLSHRLGAELGLYPEL